MPSFDAPDVQIKTGDQIQARVVGRVPTLTLTLTPTIFLTLTLTLTLTRRAWSAA